jgi:hypothetical protein
MRFHFLAFLALVFNAAIGVAAERGTRSPGLFEEHCAGCHDGADFLLGHGRLDAEGARFFHDLMLRRLRKEESE